MKLRFSAVVLACVMLTGCWDFIDPDLAAENGAATFQFSAALDRSGTLRAQATLAPGLNSDGFRRDVTVDTLRVLNFAVSSDSVLRNGNHVYSLTAPVTAQQAARGITIRGPFIEEAPLAPAARWHVARKAGPDTIRITRGSDLVVRLAEDTVTAVPPPSEHWFLALSGRERQFQISSNGRVPSEVRVPAEWIPEVADSVLNVSMTSLQSTQLLLPGYRAFMSFTVFINWIVVIR
jgi:hypothetical protein